MSCSHCRPPERGSQIEQFLETLSDDSIIQRAWQLFEHAEKIWWNLKQVETVEADLLYLIVCSGAFELPSRIRKKGEPPIDWYERRLQMKQLVVKTFIDAPIYFPPNELSEARQARKLVHKLWMAKDLIKFFWTTDMIHGNDDRSCELCFEADIY